MFTEDRLLAKYLPNPWYERINLPYGEIRRYLRSELAAHPEAQLILDAGAGEGKHHDLLKGRHVVSLDFGQGDAAWDYSALDVRGDVLAMPFADRTFDAAVCTQVIEHVRDPRQLLAELCRVVKPGGYVWVTAPLAFGEHQVPYDYFRFTSYGLRELVKALPAEIVSLQPKGGYGTYWVVATQPLYAYMVMGFPQHKLLRLALVPFRLLMGIVFLLLLPLLAFLLDGWISTRHETIGFALTLRTN